MARALSEDGFKVTILCPFDMEVKGLSPTLHRKTFDVSQEFIMPKDFMKASKNYTIKGFFLTDKNYWLVNYFFVENSHILDELRDLHFTAGILYVC